MKKIIIAISSLLISLSSQAQNAERGKELHDNRCMKCHGTEVYTRSNRRIQSLDKLGAQVRFCKNQTGVMWFDDEVDDVIHYLNQAFYQF